MILYDGSFHAKRVGVLFLFFLATLISACGGNETIDSHVEAEPEEEPPLAVSDWYPTPKHQQKPPTVYVPADPVVTRPAASGVPSQQPWAVSAPQPVYVAPQVVYQVQPQPMQQVQQPSVWSIPAPATTMTQQPQSYWYQPAPQAQVQQQPNYYYYQPAPRPWGNPVQPVAPQQSEITTDAWPQGGYVVAPWGVPATGFNATGAPTGQVFQPQPWPNNGQVW